MLPQPEPGLVISYAYLWRHEHNAGQEEGRKDRPCVIVLAVEGKGAQQVVTVAPITHRSPEAGTAIEIPPRVKAHLKLDSERSWVIINEVNQFAWPGYDLRPAPGNEGIAYGFLPPKLFERVKIALLELFAARRGVVVKRDL